MARRAVASVRAAMGEVHLIMLQPYRHDGHEWLGADVMGADGIRLGFTFVIAPQFRPHPSQPVVVDMVAALVIASLLARRLEIEAVVVPPRVTFAT